MRPGVRVRARVPATSANLGPGFDSLGLALTWYDEVEVETISEGFQVDVCGEGEETVPRDESHLIIATILEALSEWGLRPSGLRLTATNTIPHGRGLGSSSAALVSGLLLAWGLAHPDRPVDTDWLLQQAFVREGHADNVAPAIFGGFVLSWSTVEDDGAPIVAARRCQVHPEVRALALVPTCEVLTRTARGVLPEEVPFSVAVHNSSRAALLVHALSTDPDLLLPATSDQLHQDYRAQLMPQTYQVMKELRASGFAALISGAGPTALVLYRHDDQTVLERALNQLESAAYFTAHWLAIGEKAGLLGSTV